MSDATARDLNTGRGSLINNIRPLSPSIQRGHGQSVSKDVLVPLITERRFWKFKKIRRNFISSFPVEVARYRWKTPRAVCTRDELAGTVFFWRVPKRSMLTSLINGRCSPRRRIYHL